MLSEAEILLQIVKDRAIRKLWVLEPPHGAGYQGANAAVDKLLGDYLETYEYEENLQRLKRAPAPFRRAFLSIVRYSPNIKTKDQSKAFKRFTTHLIRKPEFYVQYCAHVRMIRDLNLYSFSPLLVFARTCWDFMEYGVPYGVDRNAAVFYADLYKLEHPHLSDVFSRRSTNVKTIKHRRKRSRKWGYCPRLDIDPFDDSIQTFNAEKERNPGAVVHQPPTGDPPEQVA